MANDTGMTTRRRSWLTGAPAWSLVALIGTLVIAVGGALITGSEIGTVTEGVESLSSSSSTFLSRVGDWFPLGFAFSAGMVSTVNPCGFAMLPAYLGLYMGDADAAHQAGTAQRLERALLVGSTMTAGFALMFAVTGLLIGLGASVIASAFPWVGLSIGVLLVVTGAYLMSGGKLYTNLAMRLSSKIGTRGGNGVRGYFTFGIGYGTASLSCTLPIFLAVIGGTFTADTFLDSLLQFLLYGLGMGFVIMALTLSMAVFKGAMVGGLRKMLPHVGIISAVLLLVSGAFIVYYWLTIGNLLEQIQDTF